MDPHGSFSVVMDYWPFTITQRKNKYLLLAICPLTKCIIQKPVTHASTINAAQFLVNNIVLVHGSFENVLTDRGTHFIGATLQDVLKLLHIKHLLASHYHAACDGAAERALKTFVNNRSRYTPTNQKNWDVVVAYAAFVINTNKSKTTG